MRCVALIYLVAHLESIVVLLLQTVATIGYGDTVPKTTVGRALLFVYFPLGFAVMSYCVSLLWTQLFMHAEEHFSHLKAFASLYCMRPCRERKKRQLMRKAAQRRSEMLLARTRSQQAARRMSQTGSASPADSTVQLTIHSSPNTGAVADRSSLDWSSPPPPNHVHGPSLHTLVSSNDPVTDMLDHDEMALAEEEAAELAQIDQEIHALDHHTPTAQEIAEHQSAKTDQKLALSLMFVIFIMLGGAAVFTYYETWTYWESLYFVFITLTTIGYGDFSPSVPQTKTFIIYYVMIGLGALAYVLSLVNERVTQRLDKLKEISLAAEAAEKEAEENERLALEAAADGGVAKRMAGLAHLPTWNERFLAASFEMERLVEEIDQREKTKKPPSVGNVTQLQTIASTLAALALTVGQRQTESALKHGRSDSALLRELDNTEEEELDLTSYGIGMMVSHEQHHTPPGKRAAKIVVPRSNASQATTPTHAEADGGSARHPTGRRR